MLNLLGDLQEVADSSGFRCADISPIVGPDIGLMIRAFSSCLEDDNLLVQRGILDLLVTSLRLDGAASEKYVFKRYHAMCLGINQETICS